MESTIPVLRSQIEALLSGVERLQAASVAEVPGTPSSPHAGWLEQLQDLEQSVWRLQGGPLAPLSKTLELLSQETAARLQKKVQWSATGLESVDLGLEQRQALQDALLHAVRNSVDHGIESPAIRQARQKPGIGHLHLSARVELGALRLSLEDDGAGPDLNRILARAMANGWVSEAKSKQLSEEQVCEFLFRTGFSTREAATEVSGRGMGLDVARARVEELGGRAWAHRSSMGGFALEISIPLDRVALEVDLARVGGNHVWLPSAEFEPIPASSIEEKAISNSMCWFQAMGWALGDAPTFLRSVVSPETILAVDEWCPLSAFRVFRRLDPIWGLRGLGWIRGWMAQTDSQALGAIAPKADSAHPGESLAAYLDQATLVRLSNASAQ